MLSVDLTRNYVFNTFPISPQPSQCNTYFQCSQQKEPLVIVRKLLITFCDNVVLCPVQHFQCTSFCQICALPLVTGYKFMHAWKLDATWTHNPDTLKRLKTQRSVAPDVAAPKMRRKHICRKTQPVLTSRPCLLLSHCFCYRVPGNKTVRTW